MRDRLAMLATVAVLALHAPALAMDGDTILINAGWAPPRPKQSFAMRHPKLHWCGRKLRRTCQVLNPIVQFAGATAQCITPFLL